jgi:hypothetical protein
MLENALDTGLEVLNVFSAVISIFFLLIVVLPFSLLEDMVKEYLKKKRYEKKEGK